MTLPPLPPEPGLRRALKPLAFGLLAGVLISVGLSQLPDKEALWVLLLLLAATFVFVAWMLVDLRRQKAHLEQTMFELDRYYNLREDD